MCLCAARICEFGIVFGIAFCELGLGIVMFVGICFIVFGYLHIWLFVSLGLILFA